MIDIHSLNYVCSDMIAFGKSADLGLASRRSKCYVFSASAFFFTGEENKFRFRCEDELTQVFFPNLLANFLAQKEDVKRHMWLG